ncbi:prepilin peptidase, partial [Vibrio parahaemolyticus]
FARGWLGGGDVKLISAASFFLGVESLVPFIVYTAIAGGGLSLIVLLRLLISRIAGFWGPGVDGAEAGAVEA